MENKDYLQPKPWKKGQSGNPNGRPPKTINSIMRELGEGTLLDVKMNIRMSDGTVRTKIIDLTTETNKRKYRATINEVVASTVIQQAIAGDVQSQKMFIESQEEKRITDPTEIIQPPSVTFTVKDMSKPKDGTEPETI